MLKVCLVSQYPCTALADQLSWVGFHVTVVGRPDLTGSGHEFEAAVLELPDFRLDQFSPAASMAFGIMIGRGLPCVAIEQYRDSLPLLPCPSVLRVDDLVTMLCRAAFYSGKDFFARAAAASADKVRAFDAAMNRAVDCHLECQNCGCRYRHESDSLASYSTKAFCSLACYANRRPGTNVVGPLIVSA